MTLIYRLCVLAHIVITLPAIAAIATAFIRQQLEHKQESQTVINAKSPENLTKYDDNDKLLNNDTALTSVNTYAGYRSIIESSTDLQQKKQKVLIPSVSKPYYEMNDQLEIFKYHKNPNNNNNNNNNLSKTIGKAVIHDSDYNSNSPENLKLLSSHEAIKNRETNDEKFNWQPNKSAMVADNVLLKPVKATEMKTNVQASQHTNKASWVSKETQNPNINVKDLKALQVLMMPKATTATTTSTTTKAESINTENAKDYMMTKRNFFLNSTKKNNLHATIEYQESLVVNKNNNEVNILENKKDEKCRKLNKTNDSNRVSAKLQMISKLLRGKTQNAKKLKVCNEENCQNVNEKINGIMAKKKKKLIPKKMVNIREDTDRYLCKDKMSCKDVLIQTSTKKKSNSPGMIEFPFASFIGDRENVRNSQNYYDKTVESILKRNVKEKLKGELLTVKEKKTHNTTEEENRSSHLQEINPERINISRQNNETIKQKKETVNLENLASTNSRLQESCRNCLEHLFRESGNKNSYKMNKTQEDSLTKSLRVNVSDKENFSEENEEKKLPKKSEENSIELRSFDFITTKIKPSEMSLITEQLPLAYKDSHKMNKKQENVRTTVKKRDQYLDSQYSSYEAEEESNSNISQQQLQSNSKRAKNKTQIFRVNIKSEKIKPNTSQQLKSNSTNKETLKLTEYPKFNSSNDEKRKIKIFQTTDNNYSNKSACDLKVKLSEVFSNISLNELKKERNMVNDYNKTNENKVEIKFENYKNISSLLLDKFLRSKRKKLVEAKLINFENIANTSTTTAVSLVRISNITQMSSLYETNIENYTEIIEKNMTENSINSTSYTVETEETTESVTNDFMITESAVNLTINEISYNDLCCNSTTNQNNSIIIDAEGIARNDDALTAVTTTITETITSLMPDTNINKTINNKETSDAFNEMITKPFTTISTLISTDDIISVLSGNNNNFQLLAETTKPSITNLLTITSNAIITSAITTTTAATSLWPVKHAAVVEGDVILGGLMMVHSREDTITCGPIMPQGGIQALEAMLYTLDQVNKNQLLPNVTLGAHILDDCDKDTYGLEMAVDFIKDCIKGNQINEETIR
uniref:Uncharacterized protein n=1 Tax=Glossina brevipalpis TaxID=37001 RepID=A0A1A9WGR4_9MUSC